jgi:hypothetical protein
MAAFSAFMGAAEASALLAAELATIATALYKLAELV